MIDDEVPGWRLRQHRTWFGRPAGRLAGLGECPFELGLVVPQDLLGLVDRDVAPPDQRLGVDLAGRALDVDQVVHERLGERRIVGLVVAATTVADHVDDDILGERLAVRERQLANPDHRLGIVAVHVEDRRLNRAGHVGAVDARPRRARIGGKANLVVHHDVNRAARAVAAELG